MWVWYICTGFLSGVVSGMGIGGGAILIPALTFLFAMGQREAQNINLLYFIPTAVIALFTHNNRGNIERHGLLRLTLFGLAGAVLGALIAVRIDAGLLRKGFGLFMLGMSIYEFSKKGKQHGAKSV